MSRGARVDTQPLVGSSVLHEAVNICAAAKTKSNLDLVKSLLDHGADVNEADANQRTPLHIAVNRSRDTSDESLDLEIMLMKNGADILSLIHI